MKREENPVHLKELHSLVIECKQNLGNYLNHGWLNSEGKKIKMNIIKKYIQTFDDRGILKFVKKDDEMHFLKLLQFIEFCIESSSLSKE